MEQHAWAPCFCLFEDPMAQCKLRMHVLRRQLTAAKNRKELALATHVALI